MTYTMRGFIFGCIASSAVFMFAILGYYHHVSPYVATPTVKRTIPAKPEPKQEFKIVVVDGKTHILFKYKDGSTRWTDEYPEPNRWYASWGNQRSNSECHTLTTLFHRWQRKQEYKKKFPEDIWDRE